MSIFISTKFRIDFGNPDSGNAVIFRNDSSYNFKNSKQIRANYYQNDLIIFIRRNVFLSIEDSLFQKWNLLDLI